MHSCCKFTKKYWFSSQKMPFVCFEHLFLFKLSFCRRNYLKRKGQTEWFGDNRNKPQSANVHRTLAD
jgi:hypothetical protein